MVTRCEWVNFWLFQENGVAQTHVIGKTSLGRGEYYTSPNKRPVGFGPAPSDFPPPGNLPLNHLATLFKKQDVFQITISNFPLCLAKIGKVFHSNYLGFSFFKFSF